MQEGHSALHGEFCLENGRVVPERCEAYWVHAKTPKDLTQRQLAVLVLDSKYSSSVLEGNCQGEDDYPDARMFDPSLSGLRLSQASQPGKVQANIGDLPNYGRRTYDGAPPQMRLLWEDLWRFQRLLIMLFVHPAKARHRHLWWIFNELGNIGVR